MHAECEHGISVIALDPGNASKGLGVKRLITNLTSCIYPGVCTLQPNTGGETLPRPGSADPLAKTKATAYACGYSGGYDFVMPKKREIVLMC